MTGDDRRSDPLPAAQDSAAAEPVTPAERLLAVDVLRGVALLGILAMNMVAFAWPLEICEDPRQTGGDDLANWAAWLLTECLFTRKTMTLFSMLFGAGLVLMVDRAAARGRSIRRIYYRRIFWLLVIGLIHGYLIWYGDILVSYALCGVLLYPLRRLRPGALIGLGAGLVLIGALVPPGLSLFTEYARRVAEEVDAARAAGATPAAWQLWLNQTWHEDLDGPLESGPGQVAKEMHTYREGSYLEIVAYRGPILLAMQLAGFVISYFWEIGGRMVLGMGLMKLGVFSAQRSSRFYLWLAFIGYAVGLPLTVCGMIDVFHHNYEPSQAPWGELLFEMGMVPVALGHTAVVMLLCQAGALPWLLRRLAAVGRMALTNYLVQSLLCTTLFYGYGLALFGQINRIGLWGIVFAIWWLQLTYSPIWLRYFRYGPAEWLWRTLTYGKVQPLG